SIVLLRIFFMSNKPFFSMNTAAISAQVSIAINDSMAWNDDGYLICSVSIRYCAISFFSANGVSLFAISFCLSIGNAHQLRPNKLLKGTTQQVKWSFKFF